MVLTVENCSAGYGRTTVLQRVGLQVGDKEIVALLGPHKAGKTTMLRAICGLIRVRCGDVRLHGRSIVGLSPESVARQGLRYIPLENRVFGRLTVRDNLRVGVLRDRDLDLDPVLDMFPRLARRLDVPANRLALGERLMCALGRALVSGPELIMIDDISIGLPPRVVDEIFERLNDISASGTSILLAHHDAETALAAADRAYVLEHGRITREGGAGLLIDAQTWSASPGAADARPADGAVRAARSRRRSGTACRLGHGRRSSSS